MTTSGTYIFSVARDDIIREAMLNIGKLGEAESPTAQEITDCARKLNMIVKQWMAKQDFAPGLKSWTRRRGTLFLSTTAYQYALGASGTNWTTAPQSTTLTSVAAQSATALTVSSNANINSGDYIGIQLNTGVLQWTTVASKTGGATVNLAAGLSASASTGNFVYSYTTKAQRPELIEAAILRDNQQNDTPLQIMDQAQYDLLPSKTQSTNISDPTAVYYEPQLTNGQLYTDCGGAQDVSKQIILTYLEPTQDFNNPTDTPEYPQQWFRALSWELTKEIGPMFNLPFTADMKELRDEAIAMARESYSETSSMYFQSGSDRP